MMALTADGKIAKHSDHLADWTSPEDKKEFIQATKEAGVIVMGKKTFDTIGKPLPGRLNLIMALNPDKHKELEIPGTLEFTNLPPKQIIEKMEKLGYKKIILGGGTTINSLFLKENLVDELKLTIEPKIFGAGMNLFDKVDVDLNLELIEMKKLNENTINIHYKVIK